MVRPFHHGVEVIQLDSGTYPIATARMSVIGLIGIAEDADADAFPLNTPVLITNRRQLADLGATGTIPHAMDAIYDQTGAWTVVVRVAEGADEDATITNIVGATATGTGVHAFKAAQAAHGLTPRILIAPGYTSQRPGDAANPIVSELIGIAEKLRAVVIADGPSTTDAAAVEYAEDWGSKRLYIVEGGAQVYDTTLAAPVIRPASDRVAGLIAKTDNEKGVWHSPSNKIINGLVGIGRPILFDPDSVNSQTNYLNENKMGVVIRDEGFRLWGNRTTSAEPLWAFLSVVRMADQIDIAIQQALRRHATDRPMSERVIGDAIDSVNAYLRSMIQREAIIGGKCWFDPDLNSPEEMAAGRLWISLDREPPAPIEHTVVEAARNITYYEDLAGRIASAA